MSVLAAAAISLSMTTVGDLEVSQRGKITDINSVCVVDGKAHIRSDEVMYLMEYEQGTDGNKKLTDRFMDLPDRGYLAWFEKEGYVYTLPMKVWDPAHQIETYLAIMKNKCDPEDDVIEVTLGTHNTEQELTSSVMDTMNGLLAIAKENP